MPAGLPTLADAKSYLRAADSGTEDALIQQVLDRALGAVTGYLARPIVALPQTFVVFGTFARNVLAVGASPIDTTQPITVTDGNGVTVDPSTFTVLPDLGLLAGKPGMCFATFPYTVTATWGLSARADYATVVAPAVGSAILDAAADLFQRRSPASTQESAGGGVSSSFAGKGGAPGLPQRVCEQLNPFRRIAV